MYMTKPKVLEYTWSSYARVRVSTVISGLQNTRNGAPNSKWLPSPTLMYNHLDAPVRSCSWYKPALRRQSCTAESKPNKTSLKRVTSAILSLSHENVSTPITPFKRWLLAWQFSRNKRAVYARRKYLEQIFEGTCNCLLDEWYANLTTMTVIFGREGFC